jgi:arabinan endo-1,5-alpha-L-arabinosidase
MIRIFFSILVSLTIIGTGSCKTSTSSDIIQEKLDSTKYKNPVFEPILADPTVIKADDGWFYAYGTMDNWGDGKGAHLIPVVRSKDLVHWTYVKDAFLSKPAWKEKGGIWAPEVVKVNGKYHMYYACSTWGDPNPGVGLAIADSPAGPFTDNGKLFLSSEVNVPNSIDPFYMEENGKKYVFWGSFSNEPTQGTYGVELSADGKSIPDLSKKFKVAAGDFEAVMIQKKGDFFYFLGSKGSCCEGAKSQYNIRIGRSQTIFGPFFDKDGKDLKERGTGSVLIQPNAKYAGPGHNSRWITDDFGTDWLLYHAIDRNNPNVSTGANRRVLMLDKIVWKNGWPEILNSEPSIENTTAPLFK